MLIRAKSPLLVLYTLCTGLALGSLVSTVMPLRAGLSPGISLCLGAALTPHYIGFCTLLCLLLWRKPPALLITALPALLCACGLFFCGLPSLPLFHFSITGSSNVFAAGLGVAFLTLLCWHLVRNAGQAPFHHDPIVYIGNARYLLESSNSILPLFTLKADQARYVRTSHGLSYEGYLAFARSFLGILPEWREDTALHTAFQIIVLWYAAAAYAAGLYFIGEVWGATGVVILSFAPRDWRTAINRFTREPYRIIPFIGLCTVLAAWIDYPIAENTVWFAYAAGILTYLTVDAHAIGGYLACLILSVYLGIALLVSPSFQAAEGVTWLAVPIACGLGWLAGASKYLIAYIKTGTLYGNAMRRMPFKGRHHWDVISQAVADKHESKNSPSRRCAYLVSKSGYFLPFAGGASILILTTQFFKYDIPPSIILIMCLAFFIYLPLYKTLIMNPRYLLHSYFAFALLSVYCINFVSEIYSLQVAPYAILVLGFIFLSQSSLNWYTSFNYQKNIFDNYYKFFDRCSSECQPGHIMLVSNTGDTFAAYYTHSPGYLFSTPYWNLLQAEDVKSVIELLNHHKCRYICFTMSDIADLRIRSLTLYRAIYSNCIILIQNDRYELWDCRTILKENREKKCSEPLIRHE